jgi:hypothetical protein
MPLAPDTGTEPEPDGRPLLPPVVRAALVLDSARRGRCAAAADEAAEAAGLAFPPPSPSLPSLVVLVASAVLPDVSSVRERERGRTAPRPAGREDEDDAAAAAAAAADEEAREEEEEWGWWAAA